MIMPNSTARALRNDNPVCPRTIRIAAAAVLSACRAPEQARQVEDDAGQGQVTLAAAPEQAGQAQHQAAGRYREDRQQGGEQAEQMVLVAEVDPLAERQRHHHQRDGDPGQGEEQRQAAQPRLAQWPCWRGGECSPVCMLDLLVRNPPPP